MAQFKKGRLSGQTQSGACRSEGFVAGEHVPDRFGELSGELDLGDLGAALSSETTLGALVFVAVDGVSAGVHRCFEHRPAQVFRAVL